MKYHFFFHLSLLMCLHLSVPSVFVTVAFLTARTHRVLQCALSTVTDTTTLLMALSMTTTLTARSTCLR